MNSRNIAALGVVLFIISACGGGGGGETPQIPWRIDNNRAISLTESAALNLSSDQVKSKATEIANKSDNFETSDGLFFLSSGSPLRVSTSCNGKICTSYAGVVSISDLDFSGQNIRPVLVRNGIETAQMYDTAELLDGTKAESYGYGGWMANSGFWIEALKLTDSEGSYGGAVSGAVGMSSGSDPSSGALEWNGLMVGGDAGLTISRGNAIQGDAMIRLSGFSDPEVDVFFTNVKDLNNGSDRSDMTWSDIPLSDGSFSSKSGSSRIKGDFYGSSHEEVAGTFERFSIIGAFGAIR